MQNGLRNCEAKRRKDRSSTLPPGNPYGSLRAHTPRESLQQRPNNLAEMRRGLIPRLILTNADEILPPRPHPTEQVTLNLICSRTRPQYTMIPCQHAGIAAGSSQTRGLSWRLLKSNAAADTQKRRRWLTVQTKNDDRQQELMGKKYPQRHHRRRLLSPTFATRKPHYSIKTLTIPVYHSGAPIEDARKALTLLLHIPGNRRDWISERRRTHHTRRMIKQNSQAGPTGPGNSNERRDRVPTYEINPFRALIGDNLTAHNDGSRKPEKATAMSPATLPPSLMTGGHKLLWI